MSQPKAKIAISIRQGILDRVKAIVHDERASSVSAYIEHAVSAQLAAEAAFDALIMDALEASGGPATRAERARARKLLLGAA